MLLAVLLLVQSVPDSPTKQEEEVVVTSSPLKPTDLFDTPYSADVVTGSDLTGQRLSRTLPEALREAPGLSIQKTSSGHGSPYIRGFTGFHNVLLIDGIRLNNSVFRSGPNQYWNTVDEFLIERMEVVRGPSSVLYGSDSIGGTVSVTTVEPLPSWPGSRARSFYRFASADQSHSARLEAGTTTDSVGMHTGVTYRDFGDVRGGGDTGLQRNTGYDEYDADTKLVHWAGEDSRVILAYQRTRQDDVPRTHRTIYANSWHGTAVGTDLRSDYDQERDLVYLQWHATPKGALLDTLATNLSWHHQGEEFARTRSTGARELRSFDVNTPAAWIKGGKETGAGFFTVGAEWYHDEVSSHGRDVSAAGAVTSFTRGEVADDARSELVGVYVQDEISFGALDVVPGVRFSWANIEADEMDPNPSDAIVFAPLEDTYQAVTGSARLVYHVDDHWNLIGGWGQGFRTPTLDDVSAVKLVQSGALDLPSQGLDPERSNTFDLGIRTQQETFDASVFGFYTVLRDFIRRVPSVDYNADGTLDNTKDNFADGWVCGFEAAASVKLNEAMTVRGDIGYAKGEADALVGSVTKEQPLDKMNPMIGHLGLRYETPVDPPQKLPLWAECIVTMSRHQDHLSPSDETDTQRIPPGGTPGYTVYGIRLGWRGTGLTLALDNLTDKDYRVHGSGQNEAGRSFLIGVDLRF